MISQFYIMLILEGIIAVLLSVQLIFFMKFPSLWKLLLAKRVVWEIDGDGVMTPVKARTHSGAMMTDSGIYPYTKKDVVRWSGLSGILAHKASDSRAINPDVLPVLSLLRKVNVDSLEDIEAILKAPLLTKEEYAELQKQEEKRIKEAEEEEKE